MELLLLPVLIIAGLWQGFKETWYIWVLLVLGVIIFRFGKKKFNAIDNSQNLVKAYLSKISILNGVLIIAVLIASSSFRFRRLSFFYFDNELAAFILIALLLVHCSITSVALYRIGHWYEQVLLWLSAISLGVVFGIWGSKEFSLHYDMKNYHVVMNMEDAHQYFCWLTILLIIYVIAIMLPLLMSLCIRCKNHIVNRVAIRHENKMQRDARAQIRKSLPKIDKIVKEYTNIKSNILSQEMVSNVKSLYDLLSITSGSIDSSKVYKKLNEIENAYKRQMSLELEIKKCIDAYSAINDAEMVEYYTKIVQ